MSGYLFIQSQDPFIEARTSAQFDVATQLAKAGKSVSVLLVQNGVTAARKGARTPQFDALADAGIKVFADSFALQQREIAAGDLKPSIAAADVSMVVDAMLAGDKVIWN
jgi:sulfur transfer complex TusBCD TusB component (DsrH family)